MAVKILRALKIKPDVAESEGALACFFNQGC